MLTKIDVNGDNSFTIPIVGATPKDSLLIRQITGLGPPDINLFIGDYARDGGIYQGRRVGTRNPVILAELNPNPALGETVFSLRQRLYKTFIDPQSEADYLKLDLHLDDGRVLYLVGYTEKFETEIFSSESLVQVSIICPDPYLRSESPVVRTNASGWTILNFPYEGTAETGFKAEIKITAATSTLTLDLNSITDHPQEPARGRMVIDHDFVAGDKLVINTVRGQRKIELDPVTGPVQSLLGALSVSSGWLELHSATNVMKVYGAQTSNLVAGLTNLTFIPAYWGI